MLTYPDMDAAKQAFLAKFAKQVISDNRGKTFFCPIIIGQSVYHGIDETGELIYDDFDNDYEPHTTDDHALVKIACYITNGRL